MDALTIMLLLQIKHWYVDFWIQTYQQTVCKGIYGHPVGISHSLEQATGTLIALFIGSFFLPVSFMMMVLMTIFDFLIHYHIDYVKMAYGIKNVQSTRFWREFGLDQISHQLTYLLITYIVIKVLF